MENAITVASQAIGRQTVGENLGMKERRHRGSEREATMAMGGLKQGW